MEKISVLQISYFTPDLPPPFTYQYVLSSHFKEDELLVDFKMEYIGREELEEDEIIAEGFTLDDDFTYQGSLPLIWKQELINQLDKTTYFKDIPSDYPIHVKIEGLDEKQPFEGYPADLKNWEYFLQELVQGVFEAGKRERPLEVAYKEIRSNVLEEDIAVHVSFLERSARIASNAKGKEQQENIIPWKNLKKVLKAIYMPDYFPENALTKTPLKDGKYINPGDGLWYQFGKSLKNPDPKFDSLAKLELTLKEDSF